MSQLRPSGFQISPMRSRAPKGLWVFFGVVWGVLFALAGDTLFRGVIPVIMGDSFYALSIALGVFAALKGYYKFLGAASACVSVMILLIWFTPLMPVLMKGLEVKEGPLQTAPAAVVLSASEKEDQGLSTSTQARIVHGYEVLGQGFAPLLVLTRGKDRERSPNPTIRLQMKRMGLRYPVV
jgi:hypothetical protein